MKKLLFVTFAAFIFSLVSFVNVSNASAVLRIAEDNNQAYELEGSDYDTIQNLLNENTGKKIEMWIDTDSNILQELSDAINSMDNKDTYLIIYQNEWSENNKYLYSKIKFLPINE